MKSAAAAFLLLAGLGAGYFLAPGRVAAQGNTPFVPGQTVVLTRDVGSGRTQTTCTINYHAGDFIGCVTERQIGMEERQTWYNLRFIERISVSAR